MSVIRVDLPSTAAIALARATSVTGRAVVMEDDALTAQNYDKFLRLKIGKVEVLLSDNGSWKARADVDTEGLR